MSDEGFVNITVQIPIEDVEAYLAEAGYATSDANINTVCEALGDKWMTDLTEVNEYDFIIEVMADDLEPEEDNVKAHRDWRCRQGEPDCV